MIKRNEIKGYISRDIGSKVVFFSKTKPEFDGTFFYVKDSDGPMKVIARSEQSELPVCLHEGQYASIDVKIECMVYDKDGKIVE